MGLYLFVACSDNTLRVYSIDSYAGGHIKQVASANVNHTPSSIAVDPSGRYVYVGDVGGIISGFTVDTGTGALTVMPLSGLPYVGYGRDRNRGRRCWEICLCARRPARFRSHQSSYNGAVYTFMVGPDGYLSRLLGPVPANNPSALVLTGSIQ